ncbi:hypothetical protein [Rhodococcus marinonascens]|nr:hypothetical protein [Rhodococcus marinonascens]
MNSPSGVARPALLPSTTVLVSGVVTGSAIDSDHNVLEGRD